MGLPDRSPSPRPGMLSATEWRVVSALSLLMPSCLYQLRPGCCGRGLWDIPEVTSSSQAWAKVQET